MLWPAAAKEDKDEGRQDEGTPAQEQRGQQGGRKAGDAGLAQTPGAGPEDGHEDSSEQDTNTEGVWCYQLLSNGSNAPFWQQLGSACMHACIPMHPHTSVQAA